MTDELIIIDGIKNASFYLAKNDFYRSQEIYLEIGDKKTACTINRQMTIKTFNLEIDTSKLTDREKILFALGITYNAEEMEGTESI